MAEYRAYIVGPDDHFLGFEEIVCDDDEQAIQQGRRLVDDYGIELWNGPRLVLKMKPGSP